MSRTRGIYFDKGKQLHRAQIRYQGRRLVIGYYSTESDAARAYDDKARALYGDKAIVNKFAHNP